MSGPPERFRRTLVGLKLGRVDTVVKLALCFRRTLVGLKQLPYSVGMESQVFQTDPRGVEAVRSGTVILIRIVSDGPSWG